MTTTSTKEVIRNNCQHQINLLNLEIKSIPAMDGEEVLVKDLINRKTRKIMFTNLKLAEIIKLINLIISAID